MASNSASGGVPSAETRQSRFEQGVALSLNLWPALTLAVQNNWGGPDSADKRDWFAGQVVEQFPEFTSSLKSSQQQPSSSTSVPNGGSSQQPKQAPQKEANGAAADENEEPDTEYIEELLLQVMLDEFEVNVDDESAFDVATEIMRLRTQCARGNFDDVEKLMARWQGRKGGGKLDEGLFRKGEDQDGDTDWDDTDGEEEDSDEDMDEAPPLVEGPKKEKPPPEVDEDGFTKVTRKR